MDEDEADEFHEDLLAPLDPKAARQERNFGLWLREG